MRLFFGYDEREAIGYDVFVKSVKRRASIPVDIVRLDSCGFRGCIFNLESHPSGAAESVELGALIRRQADFDALGLAQLGFDRRTRFFAGADFGFGL